ncbi:type II toxin-antitoxin system RelE/ParE family toxin [Erythrobacter sp. EC-HK427]|uniref:type II toxin-antitoxin system RelE/ParE family toxin n=1 Tax=Erythrobacter sp. EC-HK427 TaxID=2038396 RepID=UPI001251E6A9|nr:type II toxin-antitoxin system RelE/ParE family toxin [Erythrobacter sp. EC-HK427]VVS99347.1 Plasmid stabilization system [Erythrobacter sp. EC-HK427]
MNCHIDWSDAAERDLEDIWDWIAKQNIAAAQRTVEAIDGHIRLLGRTPQIGRIRAEIAPDLRALVEGNYLILYRFDESDKRVEIVRIIHQRRNLSALFD